MSRPVTLAVPGPLAEHLADTDNPEICAALAAGRTIRRGYGYSVHVCAPAEVHRMILHACWVLAAPDADSRPAERRAYRVYCDRIAAAFPS